MPAAPCLCSRIVAVTLPGQERLAVRRALQALLSRLPADVLAARCVRPVQRYIDSCVHAGLGATRAQVRICGMCLRPSKNGPLNLFLANWYQLGQSAATVD